MAGKDKVFIDIIVDDKGTTQRVAVDSKKLGVALDDVEKSQKKTGKSSKDADRNLKGLSKQSSNTTKNFSKMAQGMTGTLVPAYAILASNVFAITAAFQFLKKAADFRVIQESQVAFTGATGVGMQTLTADIQSASGAMLDFQTSSEAAAIGIASGLGSGQITDLAEGAGNLSKILGRDVTDSFNRLIRGVTKAEPELLDELGITLRLADAQTNYAATLGKSAKDLTNYEKKQAVFAEVQGQLEDKYNAVAKATDIQANSVARLGVAFDKVMKPIKSFISAIAEPTAEFFIKNIGSLTAALALLAIPIIKSIIPSTESWAETSKEAADDASQAYKDAREEMEKMEKAQTDLEASGKEADFTVEGAKKGSGIDILATDGAEALKNDKYAKNRIDLMLAHAKQNNGAIRKMDKRTGKMYILTLKKMQRGSATFFEKIAMGWHKTARAASVAAKQVEVAWKKAMAGAKKAVAGFTKFADRAFRLAGWIGMLMLAYDLLKEAAQALGFFKPNPAVEKLKAQFEELSESLETVQDEYEKFTEIQNTLLEQQKRTGEFSPLRNLQAQGNFISTTSKKMTDALSALKNFTKENIAAAVGIDAQTSSIAKLETRIAELDKKKKGNKGGALSGYWLFGGKDNREADEIAEQAKLEEDLALLQSVQGKGAEKVLAKMSDAHVNLRNKVKETAGIQLTYFKSLGPLTLKQAEYVNLLKRIEEGKEPITQETIDKANQLAKGFEETGKQASFAIEQGKNIDTSYSAMLAGITTYKTSVTDLSKQIKDQTKIVTNLQETTKDPKMINALKERVVEYNKQANVLRLINKIEIEIATKRLNLQIQYTKALAGATPLQTKALQISQKLAENDLKQLEIREKLKLAQQDEVTFDQTKIDNLNQQLQLLESQADSLERQRDLSAQIRDGARSDVESGLQSGIAGFLKGEGSIKDGLVNMAKSVSEGIIDTMAKNWTETIMQSIPGLETQEAKRIRLQEEAQERSAKKMRDAHVEGGKEVAKEIEKGGKAAAKAVKDAEKGTGAEAAGQSVNTMNVTATTVYVNGNVVDGEAGAAAGESSTGSTFADKVGEAKKKKSPAVLEETDVAAILENKRDPVTLNEVEVTAQKRDPLTGEKVGTAGAVDTMGETFNKFTGNMKKLFSGDAPFTKKLADTFGQDGLIGDLGNVFSKLTSNLGITFRGLMTSLAGLFQGMVGGGSGAGWFNAALTGVMSYFSFGGGGGLDAMSSGLIGRKGGIFEPSNSSYAMGGIAKGREAGYPAILHGTEAVVPLPNGKDIPVSFTGRSASTNNIGMTININRDDTESDVEGDTEIGTDLGMKIKEAVQQVLLDEKRAGGILSPFGVA